MGRERWLAGSETILTSHAISTALRNGDSSVDLYSAGLQGATIDLRMDQLHKLIDAAQPVIESGARCPFVGRRMGCSPTPKSCND